ncbi:SCO3242 family prenyltransferase [Streptomyces sp. NPDC058371]|uniref:SCO3242 family prenyltransferase n=1 Tax=Streptomyces sp. NPDC058371 TaxID=3346463 RepID=UPI0036657CF1
MAQAKTAEAPGMAAAQAAGGGGRRRGTGRAWAELLRLPALFTVPGDALAGAAAAGARPNPRTLLAIGSSLCLYEAGMALNDWADQAEDAVDRPHRPLPSGRIRPTAALAAAGALTAAGLALAARAGGRSLAVAVPLAATVWAYDLGLKRTPAGPAAMAAARGLDLLLGATATGGRPRSALPAALTLATHTFAVTTVSRGETQGGSHTAPLAALLTTGAVVWGLTRGRPAAGTDRRPQSAHRGTWDADAGLGRSRSASGLGSGISAHRGSWDADAGIRRSRSASGLDSGISAHRGTPDAGSPSSRPASGQGSRIPTHRGIPAVRRPSSSPGSSPGSPPTPTDAIHTALTVAYAVTSARPLFHAALNPSPPLTQRAVGGGIRAMIPLQAALAARAGAPAVAVLTALLAPAARKFARKVSVT